MIKANISSGGISTSNLIVGEIPSGSVNGSNKVFTAANTITSGTLEVFVNGQALTLTADYTFTSPSTITMSIAPATGSNILINYIKQ